MCGITELLIITPRKGDDMKKPNTFILLLSSLCLLSICFNVSAQIETGGKLCSDGKIQNGINSPDAIMITPHNPFNIINYKLDFDLYNNFLTPFPRSFNASEVVTFRVDTA